jgi:hypothetical protein
MSMIYQKTVQLFGAETPAMQEKLYYEIQRHIQDALSTKQDNFLNLALNEAEANNKVAVWSHIQKIIVESVNTLEYSKDGKDYVSHLFILPFLVMPSENTLNLPSIETMESWWREYLSQNYLIAPGGMELNFAPVLLGKNAASNMSMGEWYQIHKANSTNLDKRNTRAMFDKPFQIQVQADKPHLSFLVATINQEKNNNLGMPLLDLTEQRIETLNQVIEQVSEIYNEQIPNSTWLFMPIGSVTDIIAGAFDTYQDLLVSTLIRSYSPNPGITFGLVPTANNQSFALLAWHGAKNLVVDALILNQYTKPFPELVDMVMETLTNQNINSLYVGDHEISIEQFNNLGKLDFNNYIRKNGINTLKSS